MYIDRDDKTLASVVGVCRSVNPVPDAWSQDWIAKYGESMIGWLFLAALTLDLDGWRSLKFTRDTGGTLLNGVISQVMGEAINVVTADGPEAARQDDTRSDAFLLMILYPHAEVLDLSKEDIALAMRMTTSVYGELDWDVLAAALSSGVDFEIFNSLRE
jgi:hypothetical protein